MIRSVLQTHLRTVLAVAAAGLFSACGCGGDSSPPSPPLPPPPPPPSGVTYDVVPLTLGTPGYGDVRPQGINASGQVAGTIFGSGGSPTLGFLYDGSKTVSIGTLGGASSEALGINRCGHVAGWAELADGRPHAAIYDGTLHDLGSIAPGGRSQAYALNDCDTAVGWSTGPGGDIAFYYNGSMHGLGTFGGNYASSLAVNNNGVVTGYSFGPANATAHGFTYAIKTGLLTQIDTLGGARSMPEAINDAGTVVGWSDTTTTDAIHAFRFDGTIHDLGTLGGANSEATWINAKGLIVGRSETPDSWQHAFIYDGTMHDLGTLGGSLSDAVAINKDGVVVGSATTTGNRAEHAMAWTQAGGMVDLNNQLVSPPPQLELAQALAVSDNGSIVVRADHGELYLLKVHH